MITFSINGQGIHARTEGKAHAPVAILVHGWSSSWYTWAPLLPALSRRFYCIAVDLPGYGRSPAPQGAPSIVGYADLLADLIQQVSDHPVLVMGHSMGGQIAMTLALRFPVLLERLVLLNPAVSGRLSSFVNFIVAPHILLERFSWTGRLLTLLERTPLNYTDYLLRPISFAERAVISPEDYSRIRADARRSGQGRIRAECFWAMREADLRGRLSGIRTPALVIWGAEDNTVPLRDAGLVAAEWPQADLRLIPNAGHWPHFEQYELALRHIGAFLGLPQIYGDDEPLEGEDVSIAEIAQFLASSDLGHGMSDTQRARLAAQLRPERISPGYQFAAANSKGEELFLVQEGTVEVWATVNATGLPDASPRRIASLPAGQIVGEMALLEESTRSAALRAGAQGATVLSLSRRRFEALGRDDPELALGVMANLARSLSLRLRLQNWQTQSAERKYEESLLRQRAVV